MKKYLVCFFIIVLAIKANAQNDLQLTAKGSQYRLFTHNTGDRIKLNDVVTFNLLQKTDKDSILFSSYTTGSPVQIQIQPAGDLMDIFPLMTLKDSALVKMPSDSVFKKHEDQRPPFLPKGSNLIFVVKIEKVQSLDEAIAERNASLDKLKSAETENANKYIADHNLIVKTTPSGLKYIITRLSLKRKPLAGDTLLVNYTGRTLDGKVFDSSIEAEANKAGLQQPGRTYEPLQLIVGKGQVIPGWDEGLLLLNEGSQATFIVPSSLAYGDKGAGEDIKPFSTLIFNVELVKIKPIKHPAVKPALKKHIAKKHIAAKKKS
jgi:FKBP-type peptidyl-prolyl cis-trans isomerase FkpA